MLNEQQQEGFLVRSGHRFDLGSYYLHSGVIMEFTNLVEWQNAVNARGFELEHDADMDVWFAWHQPTDTCMGAFNIENNKGDL